EAHGRGDAAPVFYRAEAGPVAEMGDDGAPGQGRAGDLREARHHRLVGQTVEAIAAQAALPELERQGEACRLARLRGVKRRVEAGDLRQIGEAAFQRADGRDVVRLLQRGQRNQLLQRL